MSATSQPPLEAAVIGAGPAGLRAAEALAAAGVAVDVFDAMPSVGRKFLLAGRGGLNLTHSEPLERFLTRYREAANRLAPWVRASSPDHLREWARGLGVDTFVGSSGRVFPQEMKAAPLLRAWLQRLRRSGVRLHMRHRWRGWDAEGACRFTTPEGACVLRPRAVVLALGGASWPRLGSDGSWVPWLRELGVPVRSLVPSNCGFDVGWSEHLRTRFAGQPLKSVALSWQEDGRWQRQRGEFVLTETGVEGSLVYAASAALREQLAATGQASLLLDLLPDRSLEQVREEVARPRGPRSLSTHLKSRLKIDGAKAALLHELAPREALGDSAALATLIKALPVPVRATRPIEEAISTAGGVQLEALDENLMLQALPGVFCAGEMLDWEAPTGGYLLTACLATGQAAGEGAARWLQTGAPVPGR
ncbi:MAG: TIGR03862 family flavoprotein [Rubrivivax sp.]